MHGVSNNRLAKVAFLSGHEFVSFTLYLFFKELEWSFLFFEFKNVVTL